VQAKLKLKAGAKTPPGELKEDDFWRRVGNLGLATEDVSQMLGMTVEAWQSSGKTLNQAIQVISKKLAERGSDETPTAKPGEEGFSIDLEWLKESLNELKWSEETAKTWLVSKYKVSPVGTLAEIISRLTREQAEEFIHEIQERLAHKQLELWE